MEKKFYNKEKIYAATFSHDSKVLKKKNTKKYYFKFSLCFCDVFCAYMFFILYFCCRRIFAGSSRRNIIRNSDLLWKFSSSIKTSFTVFSQLIFFLSQTFFSSYERLAYKLIYSNLLNSFEMFCNCRIYVWESFGYFWWNFSNFYPLFFVFLLIVCGRRY